MNQELKQIYEIPMDPHVGAVAGIDGSSTELPPKPPDGASDASSAAAKRRRRRRSICLSMATISFLRWPELNELAKTDIAAARPEQS